MSVDLRSGQPRRVLLVDDDPKFGMLVRSMLEDDGFVAEWAGSADDASAVLDRFTPDVAVLDLVMPGRDGLAVADEITERLPACEIILFSSVFDERLRERLRGEGFLYLEKTSGYGALLEMLGAFARTAT